MQVSKKPSQKNCEGFSRRNGGAGRNCTGVQRNYSEPRYMLSLWFDWTWKTLKDKIFSSGLSPSFTLNSESRNSKLSLCLSSQKHPRLNTFETSLNLFRQRKTERDLSYQSRRDQQLSRSSWVYQHYVLWRVLGGLATTSACSISPNISCRF